MRSPAPPPKVKKKIITRILNEFYIASTSLSNIILYFQLRKKIIRWNFPLLLKFDENLKILSVFEQNVGRKTYRIAASHFNTMDSVREQFYPSYPRALERFLHSPS